METRQNGNKDGETKRIMRNLMHGIQLFLEEAGKDRKEAAEDRKQAAEDRKQAAKDRERFDKHLTFMNKTLVNLYRVNATIEKVLIVMNKRLSNIEKILISRRNGFPGK